MKTEKRDIKLNSYAPNDAMSWTDELLTMRHDTQVSHELINHAFSTNVL